jgi:hypothetical protein
MKDVCEQVGELLGNGGRRPGGGVEGDVTLLRAEGAVAHPAAAVGSPDFTFRVLRHLLWVGGKAKGEGGEISKYMASK